MFPRRVECAESASAAARAMLPRMIYAYVTFARYALWFDYVLLTRNDAAFSAPLCALICATQRCRTQRALRAVDYLRHVLRFRLHVLICWRCLLIRRVYLPCFFYVFLIIVITLRRLRAPEAAIATCSPSFSSYFADVTRER